MDARGPATVIRPMLATAGPLPPPDVEDQWAFEMKWDGVRAVVYTGGGGTRILSRSDRDVSASYPELAALAGALGGRDAVLDGEIVALDAAGRPDFSTLQQRMHVLAPSAALISAVPAVLMLFDVLRLDGQLLTRRPYTSRRLTLEGLGLSGPAWQVPPALEGDGAHAMAAAVATGLEGVVAKLRTSVYEPGRRSRSWVKIKHQRMQEVVIGGWQPGQGRRDGTIGSLLLGVREDDGSLSYAGHVGTGFTQSVLQDLSARLAGLEVRQSPFGTEIPRALARSAHWVRPELVGEVTFTEWTPEGRLRHPAWRGLRPDKDPGDVRREP